MYAWSKMAEFGLSESHDFNYNAVYKPGKLRILTPIRFMMKTERMIKIKPEIAEVIIF